MPPATTAPIAAVKYGVSAKLPTATLHKWLRDMFLIREFAHCNGLLWRDKLGQISLAVTTLFWGAGAIEKETYARKNRLAIP